MPKVKKKQRKQLFVVAGRVKKTRVGVSRLLVAKSKSKAISRARRDQPGVRWADAETFRKSGFSRLSSKFLERKANGRKRR